MSAYESHNAHMGIVPRVCTLVLFHFTQWGHSALMMAARKGRIDVVSLLLETGVNIDLQDDVRNYDIPVVNENCAHIPIFCLSHHTEWRYCTDVGY